MHTIIVAFILNSFHTHFLLFTQDELDAAEKVTKSNKEIRQVLIDYDQMTNASKSNAIFGSGIGYLFLMVDFFLSFSFLRIDN